eukprot:jgi/Tetstr1/466594/TSEL_011082.t1
MMTWRMAVGLDYELSQRDAWAGVLVVETNCIIDVYFANHSVDDHAATAHTDAVCASLRHFLKLAQPSFARAAVQPRFAARMREQTKFMVDACSSHSDARRHRFVPCVAEELGGRLREHRLALLKKLAERGVATASSPGRGASSDRPLGSPTGYGGNLRRYMLRCTCFSPNTSVGTPVAAP